MAPHLPEKILIVEDDSTLARVLRDNFEFNGYAVTNAADGRQAWELFSSARPDLVILDLMLPHVNGLELCRRIRKADAAVPVIMLTAKGQDSDIVLGLNLGADDYVPKPFSIDVLLARAAACLRRKRGNAADPGPMEFGDCRLDVESRQLFRKGKEVALRPKEFLLLSYFLRHPGHALTRDHLLDAVWGQDLIVTQRSVDRCVTTLRKKIEPDPEQPRFIVTVRDCGYRFELGGR